MTLPAYAMNVSSFPEMYERSLVGPLFRPWAEVLLQHIKLKAGSRVLDLACGTGIVARLAKEQLGDKARVVGIDVSAPMLGVASAIAPGIDWREGNASALPVKDDEKFDVVVCQQGLQFFSDKAAAAREMRRVLAPGGKLAIAVWRSLEDNSLFCDLHRVAERHVGPISDQRFGFADAKALERVLVEAGFQDVRVESMSRTMHLPDGAGFVRMNAMGLVGMSAKSAALGDEERARMVGVIANESGAVLPRYAVGAGLTFEMSTHIATARG